MTITRHARNILMFGLVIALVGLLGVVAGRLLEASHFRRAAEIWGAIGSNETQRAFAAYAALFALGKRLLSGSRRAGLGVVAAAFVSLLVFANPIVVAAAPALPLLWSIVALAIAVSPILNGSTSRESSRSSFADDGAFLASALLFALVDAVVLANATELRGGDATLQTLAAAATRSLVGLLDYRHPAAIAVDAITTAFQRIAAVFILIGLLEEWSRQLGNVGARRELAYLPIALILCDRSIVAAFSDSPSLAVELLLVTMVFTSTRRHADDLSLGRMLATALALVAYWLVSPNWALLIPAFATALFFSVPEKHGSVAPRIAAVTVAVFPLAAVQISAAYVGHLYGLRLGRLDGVGFSPAEILATGLDRQAALVCAGIAVALTAGLSALRAHERMRGALDAAGRSFAAAMPAALITTLYFCDRSPQRAPYLISFACLSGVLVLVIAREVASARLIPAHPSEATAA